MLFTEWTSLRADIDAHTNATDRENHAIKQAQRIVSIPFILDGEWLLELAFPTPTVPALVCRSPKLVYASSSIVGHLPSPSLNHT
jgi:hypothetical protein